MTMASPSGWNEPVKQPALIPVPHHHTDAWDDDGSVPPTPEQLASRRISRATFGVESRPVPVASLGIPVVSTYPADQVYNMRACVMETLNVILRRGQAAYLNLRTVEVTEPALVWQQTVQQGPLRHYLTNTDQYDPTQLEYLPLPVIVKVGGPRPTDPKYWLVSDGTHRYVADLLMGRTPVAFAVSVRLPCLCAQARESRQNPWNAPRVRQVAARPA